jgi:hypothetical protein
MNQRSKAPSSAQIRAHLRDRGPMFMCEILAAFGVTIDRETRIVHKAVQQMVRAGFLAREGEAKPYRYAFVREPARQTIEEKRAKQRAKNERHRRKVGMRTRAEWLAERAANAKPKPKPRIRLTPEERLERQRERKRKDYERRAREQGVRPRVEYVAARKASARKPEAQQPVVTPRHLRSVNRETVIARDVACAAVKQPLPDSSTWTGPIERLPPGAVSKASALKFDHRRAA